MASYILQILTVGGELNEIPVEKGVTIFAEAGVEYALLDGETRQNINSTQLKRVDDSLLVEIEGELVVLVDNFYGFQGPAETPFFDRSIQYKLSMPQIISSYRAPSSDLPIPEGSAPSDPSGPSELGAASNFPAHVEAVVPVEPLVPLVIDATPTSTPTPTPTVSAPTANFTAATDDVGSVTGTLSSGDSTDDTALVLSGTNESGSTVNVYNGTNLLGAATVSGTTWSYTATVADGTTYQFNVKETNAAGNTSAATSNFAVTGDTAAPTANFTAATDNIGSVTGTLSLGDSTDDTALVLSGTNESGSTVNVYDGTSLLGAATISGTTWSYTATVADGTTYQFNVKEIDAAGNTSAATSNFTIIGDTTAPTTTISGIDISADTGTSATDFETKTASQTITGTLSATLAAGEILYGSVDGGSTYSNVTAKVSGTVISWDGATLSGTSSIKFKVTDAAGNDGTVATQAYVLDTAAPTTTVATKQFSADTGTSSTDFVTKTAAQTISGTLSTVTASGEIVEVSLDNGSTWATASNTTGQNSWSLAGQTLTGNNTLHVRVTDAAGNSGTVTTQAYVLDTAAPTLSSSTPADNANNIAVADNIVLTFNENIQAGSGNIVISDGSDTRTIAVGDAQVGISGNTVTINPTANLNAGSTYNVQMASGVIEDTAGNDYAGITNATTLNFSTAAAGENTTIVVFDLVNGVSSDHSSRTFDVNVDYTIYIYMQDATQQLFTTPQAGAAAGATWSQWSGATNLTAEDQVLIAGQGSASSTGLAGLKGAGGGSGIMTTALGFTKGIQSSMYQRTWDHSPGANKLAKFFNATLTRWYGGASSKATLWAKVTPAGFYPTDPRNLGVNTATPTPLVGNHYVATMPSSILISQGLV